MLRITHKRQKSDRTTLRLEGSVGSVWADLLERECSGLLRAGIDVSLDLAEIDFVDLLGVEALRRLSSQGVAIRCRFGAVASVLEAEGVLVTLVPDGAPRKGGGPAAQ